MCAREDDPTTHDRRYIDMVDPAPTLPTTDAEAPPPEIEHAECDHPRWCAATGRPLPGHGPDGAFPDVTGDLLLDQLVHNLLDRWGSVTVRRRPGGLVRVSGPNADWRLGRPPGYVETSAESPSFTAAVRMLWRLGR